MSAKLALKLSVQCVLLLFLIAPLLASCTKSPRTAASAIEQSRKPVTIDLSSVPPEPVPVPRKPPKQQPKSKSARSSDKVFERGMASWYGAKFHGRRTASGEPFNMNAMTAAHPTLPFGTMLRIERIDGPEWVEVRVNDRGPFKKSRVIDLSYAAAKKIDLIREGTAKVAIKVIKLGKG